MKKRNFLINILIAPSGILLLLTLILVSCTNNQEIDNNMSVKPDSTKIMIDPLSLRWTFGNHEPVSMYRRVGRRSTGGIEGGALWLEDWHQWYDSEESANLMESLGLNILHCRFYKGMGWDFESKVFPDVKKFVGNCHKHNIKVLAYTQFTTLYYETMLEEIPELENWVALDEHGDKRIYRDRDYFRWIPCTNTPEFEEYLKKVIRIALEEGNFDGIMVDNSDAPACYCPRCVELFREYLSDKIPDPEERFGILNFKHVLPPVMKTGYGENQDPLYQQWVKFRCERVSALYRRLYNFSKSINPSAIFSGNIQNIRRRDMAGAAALDMADMADCFDLFVSQSGNAPGLDDGCIINRVREMKLSKVLKTPILALCDDDAGASEEKYVLTLMEDAIFGGIPTDRTIMKPDRDMVSQELINFRKPILQLFNKIVSSEHESLAVPSYEPVKLLYSYESMMYSKSSHNAILGAEEVFLRNHVPYGLLPSSSVNPLVIPVDCEVLVVCNQNCLSSNEINTIIGFAQSGRSLIITGGSGWHDELYRQRRNNPFKEELKGLNNVAWLNETEFASVKDGGWTIKVENPGEAGQHLMESLKQVWSPIIRIYAPETVFAEVKRNGGEYYVHLLNYAPGHVMKGARIEVLLKGLEGSENTFVAPLENRSVETLVGRAIPDCYQSLELPGFDQYALIKLGIKNKAN